MPDLTDLPTPQSDLLSSAVLADVLVGDVDGVMVVPAELAGAAFARALEKVTGENRVREELARGRSLREAFAEYGIL
jgi:regulator of RNase E activity RraA